jgi:hypothetical protein
MFFVNKCFCSPHTIKMKKYTEYRNGKIYIVLNSSLCEFIFFKLVIVLKICNILIQLGVLSQKIMP